MSENVIAKGKIFPINLTLQDVMNMCPGCEAEDLKTPEDWIEELECSEFHSQFVHIKGQWYKVASVEKSADMFHTEFKKNDDGSVEFLCMYYNGGTDWQELVAEFLESE